MPAPGAFAIDPPGGGSPYAEPFGQPGAGNTIPATAAVVVAQDTAVSAAALDDGSADAVPVSLPDLMPESASAGKKARA